ncbi:hypothetical protein R3P38DRAFT_2794628 [Favolaschia claudopus]|uniref:Uncharacterized protein n=1 Tax=Favolaschia claudopus TaxID=2862362 RepID=A0AAW0A8P6_9AGAR
MSAASRLHDLLFLHSIHRCRVVLDSFVNTLNHVQLVPHKLAEARLGSGHLHQSKTLITYSRRLMTSFRRVQRIDRPQLRMVALAWAPAFFRGSILVFEHTLPTGEWQFSQHSRIGGVSYVRRAVDPTYKRFCHRTATLHAVSTNQQVAASSSIKRRHQTRPEERSEKPGLPARQHHRLNYEPGIPSGKMKAWRAHQERPIQTIRTIGEWNGERTNKNNSPIVIQMIARMESSRAALDGIKRPDCDITPFLKVNVLVDHGFVFVPGEKKKIARFPSPEPSHTAVALEAYCSGE